MEHLELLDITITEDSFIYTGIKTVSALIFSYTDTLLTVVSVTVSIAVYSSTWFLGTLSAKVLWVQFVFQYYPVKPIYL